MTKLPSRLHHTAYVTTDQEKTRRFYEDVIGLPLTATWCESDVLFGKERTYVHTFYGIGDGGALAFFQFAIPPTRLSSVHNCRLRFHHMGLSVDQETQAQIEERIRKAGIVPPDTYVLEHGYCRSVYVTDPNGLILEFTLGLAAGGGNQPRAPADAHQSLKRWLAGDHHSNNDYR